MLHCRLMYMLSMLYVRLTIKVKDIQRKYRNIFLRLFFFSFLNLISRHSEMNRGAASIKACCVLISKTPTLKLSQWNFRVLTHDQRWPTKWNFGFFSGYFLLLKLLSELKWLTTSLHRKILRWPPSPLPINNTDDWHDCIIHSLVVVWAPLIPRRLS